MYAYLAPDTEPNRRIANAIKATFAGVSVEITEKGILFRTDSDVTIVSIRAAYEY